MAAYIKTMYEDIEETKAVYPRTKTQAITNEEGVHLDTLLNSKQDTLRAGANITIENDVISAQVGASDYSELTNKPTINNVELDGNTSTADLGINYSDIQNRVTKVSELTNDTGFITSSYHDSTKQNIISDLATIRTGAAKGATALQSETDPTVPAWAKQPTKPTYTASEVNALPDTTHIPTDPVQSDWNETDDTKLSFIKNKPQDLGKVDDVKVNGESVVTDKVANIVVPKVVKLYE